MPAIEEAFYAMKNVQTRYKHVLVLTDAGVESGDYEAVLRRMADEGMTVSTVLVGPGRHSDFLVDLADWGGGRYYNATDRFHLPELLLKKPSTSILPSYRPERVEVITRAGKSWFGDQDLRAIPPVDGYVECELRPGASELMTTQRARSPLIATRVEGLGRVTAMMTEPFGAGTRSWKDWPGYGPLLARVLTRSASFAKRDFEFRSSRRGARVRVLAKARTMRARRAELPPPAFFEARATTESSRQELRFRPLAADLFEHVNYVEPARDFEFVVDEATGTRRIVVPREEGRTPELQVDPEAAIPLLKLAARSGATRLDVVAEGERASPELRASPASGALRAAAVWPWLALVALLLFVLDVYYRRRPTVRTRTP